MSISNAKINNDDADDNSFNRGTDNGSDSGASADKDCDDNTSNNAGGSNARDELMFISQVDYSNLRILMKLFSMTGSQSILLTMISLIVDGPQYDPCHSNRSTMIPVMMIVIIQTTLHEKWYVDLCFHFSHLPSDRKMYLMMVKTMELVPVPMPMIEF